MLPEERNRMTNVQRGLLVVVGMIIALAGFLLFARSPLHQSVESLRNAFPDRSQARA